MARFVSPSSAFSSVRSCSRSFSVASVVSSSKFCWRSSSRIPGPPPPVSWRVRDASTSSSSSTPGTHASGPADATSRTTAAPLTSLASTRSTRRRSASRSSPGPSAVTVSAERGTPETVMLTATDGGVSTPASSTSPRRSASRATSQTAVESPICAAGVNCRSAARSRARRRVSRTSSWVRRASVRTAVAIEPNASSSPLDQHGQNPHIATRPDNGPTDGSDPPGGPALTDRRLLIVEDSPTMRRVMRRFLETTGYVIFEAGDGEEALRLAAQERPDVILLDRQIPRLDGYGVLASLREDPELGEVPVVLVTSHGEPDEVADGLTRGAHDYLRKPFEQQELVARVHAAMRTKALQDELRARNAQLERLVSTDLLTGLLNRAAVGDHLRALVSRTQRHGAPLSVLLLDVDGIGEVTARHGHAAGDAVLKALAERVGRELREEDAAGRWSGDQILVVGTGTAADGAAALIERPRGAAGVEPVAVAGEGIAAPFAPGAATWTEGDAAEALALRAKQALAS